jgi:hypothetical protein
MWTRKRETVKKIVLSVAAALAIATAGTGAHLATSGGESTGAGLAGNIWDSAPHSESTQDGAEDRDGNIWG